MQEEKTNIHVPHNTRHWLRDSLTCVVEAFFWVGCVYAAALLDGLQAGKGIVPLYIWLIVLGWGLVFLLVVTHFIPSNVYSRTARRDEVVACAMKTALAFSVLAFAAFTERDNILITGCLLFFVALTIERLILNSWFIRYSTRPAHCEHAVLLCKEEDAWQLQALQQNTYGLKLNHLEIQTAQQLADYLAEHPETESVYCVSSTLQASELEAIAHTCRERGIMLRLLPQPIPALNKAMLSECRGSINVLSPAKLPLQSPLNRIVKRLTDIVLSIIVLLTIFPVFALIAFIFIKKQSQGPVLITRHMCGMNGKTFQSLTFRTRHYEAAPSFLDGTDDPGYFPFGKFLANSKLELLPQFLCVLWGSMTIVGSETMRPEQYADYRSEMSQLFASGYRLKAGITSYQFPAQTVYNPSLFTFHSSLTKADIWYYRNWGFWLDLRIMLQRIAKLLSNSKAKSINYI